MGGAYRYRSRGGKAESDFNNQSGESGTGRAGDLRCRKLHQKGAELRLDRCGRTDLFRGRRKPVRNRLRIMENDRGRGVKGRGRCAGNV